MARTILTVTLIVLLNVAAGCTGIDSGRSQLVPTEPKLSPAGEVRASRVSEADIIEQVVNNRQAYEQALELLVAHYTETGNNMKLQWARNELKAVETMPQYNYIIEAGVAGPDLKANTAIPEADEIYRDAFELERKAGVIPLLVDENLLRQALEKYNQLIKKHPSSNRIDDAAYRAAGIYSHFRDYSTAVLYYQRALQWDPQGSHPAAFKAAYILDRYLHRRAEALGLYQQAVKNKNLNTNYKTFAEKRIYELTQSGEDVTSK